MEIIKSRSKILHQLSDKKKLEFYRNNIMHESRVLFESNVEEGYIYGFTENYIRVKTPYRQEYINNIINVKLHDLDEENIIFNLKLET